MIEVFVIREMVGPVIEQAEVPQGGEYDVVKEGGIGRGERGAACPVIKNVHGEAWRFLPFGEHLDGDGADAGGSEAGGWDACSWHDH